MNRSQDSSSGRSSGVPRNLPGLLGEVEQDGGGIEDARLLAARPVGVDDRRHLAVRVDRPEGRRVLLALAGVDRDRLVGQARLFQEERDLRGVRRRVEIEADHEVSFGSGVAARPARGYRRPRSGRAQRFQRGQDGLGFEAVAVVDIDGGERHAGGRGR